MSILVLTITCGGALAAPTTVTGEVVDEDGQRVAGAQVWLIRSEWWQEEALLKATTADDAGRFALAEVEFVPSTERNYDLTVAAYRAGLAIGWSRLGHKPTGLRVICSPPAPATGRVVSTDGRPILAQVEPARLQLVTLRRPSRPWDELDPPSELAEALAVRTQPGGRFALPWRPAGAAVWLKVSAPGYGRSVQYTDFSRPCEIVLAPAGALKAHLVCEEHPELVAGLTVFWGGSLDAARTDAGGRFEFPELQPDTRRVRLQLGPLAQWRAPEHEVEVKSGQTTEVEIALRQAFRVSGRVVEEGTGREVPGAKVVIYAPTEGDWKRPTTGADGRYVTYVLPGKCTVGLAFAPPGHTKPGYSTGRFQRHEVVVEDGGVRVPDFTVKRAVTLRGVVVGPGGKPVPWAPVWYPTARGGVSPFDWVAADDTGQFHIGGLDPDVSIVLLTHCGGLVSQEPLSVPVNSPQPVILPLYENVGARLRLQAVDDKGRPVPGAEIRAGWEAEGLTYLSLDLGETEQTGIFESEPLWPFGSYALTVAAAGFGQAQTGQWEARPGQWHDFGQVVIPIGAGFIAGRVVDQQGNPVADVTVFNKTEAPEPRQAQTHADGHFRLEGLFEGRAFLFARGPGCFTTGTLAKVGREDVVLNVVRMPKQAKLAEATPVEPLTDPETELEVAKGLIEEALDMIPPELAAEGPEERVRESLIGALGRIHADRALELSAEHGGKYDARIMEELGKHLIRNNPEMALGYLLTSERPDWLAWQHVWVAKRLVKTEPRMARNLLEAAIELAEATPDPATQAALLAEAGGALWQLDPTAAEPIIRMRAQQLQALAERDPDAEGAVAEALCLIDLPAALQLLESIEDEWERQRHLRNIAAGVAATHPEQAEELLKDLSDDDDAPRVLYAMALTDYERASRLAGSLDSEQHKARALGYIAEAVARRWPERALAAFEAALGIIREAEQKGTPSAAQGWALAAAELAHVGAQMGYPYVEELCWEAISLLPAPVSGGARLEAPKHGEIALHLAFSSPRIGSQFAEHVISRGPPAAPSGGQRGTHWYEQLCAAAAVANAQSAAAIVRGLPDRLPDVRGPLKLACCAAAADVLSTPRERRQAEIVSEYTHGWVPGSEAE